MASMKLNLGSACSHPQTVLSRVGDVTKMILRLVRRYRILVFLSLVCTLMLVMIIFPAVGRLVVNGINVIRYRFVDEASLQNKTFLLTINHDLGRLGNKMFKYATLMGVAKRERRQPFVFPYNADVDMEDMFHLTHVEHHTQYRTFWWTSVEETEYAYFDPVFVNLPRRNLKLHGYVQSWKYFHDVEEQLRQEFRLTDRMKAKANVILNGIRDQFPGKDKVVFVGVHVRRRDSLSTTVTCLSPKSYFLKSFEKMRTLLPGQRLVFVVAGNDLAWCEENLAGDNVVVLKSDSAAVHFAALASCQHFILSIGSFGWWAGWMTGGHVIFYEKFPLPHSSQARGFHYQDYYPPSWIPLGD